MNPSQPDDHSLALESAFTEGFDNVSSAGPTINSRLEEEPASIPDNDPLRRFGSLSRETPGDLQDVTKTCCTQPGAGERQMEQELQEALVPWPAMAVAARKDLASAQPFDIHEKDSEAEPLLRLSGESLSWLEMEADDQQSRTVPEAEANDATWSAADHLAPVQTAGQRLPGEHFEPGEMEKPDNRNPSFLFDTPVIRSSSDPLDAYRIRGGLYSAEEKYRALNDPAGLLHTADVVLGKEERRITSTAPYPTSISKEMWLLEDGKVGQFVENYNEFTDYFEEVLRAIGRLRDLLSAGAPEAPTEMTAAQIYSLRPTDDTEPNEPKKRAYGDWAKAQAEYSKLVLQVGKSSEMAERQRRAFWSARIKLGRSLSTQLDKPTFDAVDIKLADVAAVIADPTSIFPILGDMLVDAYKKRQEYDDRMKAFLDLVRTTKAQVTQDFVDMRDAGKVYWDQVAAHAQSIADRNNARTNSRREAALLGQKLAPPAERRAAVLAEIRMPELVWDAWRALASAGAPALKKLNAAVLAKPVVDRARFHKMKPDPTGTSEIVELTRTYNRAVSWRPVITQDDVEEWVAMDKLWSETFTKFNV